MSAAQKWLFVHEVSKTELVLSLESGEIWELLCGGCEGLPSMLDYIADSINFSVSHKCTISL
jgi:hypothetical protein